MAQEGLHTRIDVTASGLIKVEGKTETGRELVMYIYGDSIEKLRQTFALAEKHDLLGDRLGHAYWHIREGVAAPCGYCKP